MKNEARVFITNLIHNGNDIHDIVAVIDSFKEQGMNNYALQLEKEMFNMAKELKVNNVTYFVKGSYNSKESEELTGWSFICVKNNKVIAKDNGHAIVEGKHVSAVLKATMMASIHANKNGYKDVKIVSSLSGVSDWLSGDYKGKSPRVIGYREFMLTKILPFIGVTFVTGNENIPNNIEKSLVRGAIAGINK